MRITKSFSLALTAMVVLNCLSAARAAPSVAEVEINHLLGLIEQSGCEFLATSEWFSAALAHYRKFQ
jgi:hypothetical protein